MDLVICQHLPPCFPLILQDHPVRHPVELLLPTLHGANHLLLVELVVYDEEGLARDPLVLLGLFL